MHQHPTTSPLALDSLARHLRLLAAEPRRRSRPLNPVSAFAPSDRPGAAGRSSTP